MSYFHPLAMCQNVTQKFAYNLPPMERWSNSGWMTVHVVAAEHEVVSRYDSDGGLLVYITIMAV